MKPTLDVHVLLGRQAFRRIVTALADGPNSNYTTTYPHQRALSIVAYIGASQKVKRASSLFPALR